ncbi:predicted protein [Sclerotinia sclerotiorum 1980 UF-70]|uniref:Uncharacterized protein n=1 Tax=Sclerotinia sclerotiorum (strain ATCC 18683 / 1980 / Ss-1) TaxID=665079 RepID=A7EP03_SCLS1|nr:predicted protein [Sclerotinia sclerotiorum 1980 UF-70]EDO04569.1 predicted protein [Sclerotinia sclerotiorum 1980 UF-70]
MDSKLQDRSRTTQKESEDPRGQYQHIPPNTKTKDHLVQPLLSITQYDPTNAFFAYKKEKGNQNQNARQSGRYTSKTETLFV